MSSIQELISIMGSDNNMPPLQVMPTQEQLPSIDLAMLEDMASKLTYEEADLLVTGEHYEVSRLIEDKGLQELDRFLNLAFDGSINELYYVGV